MLAILRYTGVDLRTNEPLCILEDAVKSRGAESGRIPNCCANFSPWALLDRNDRASLDPYSDRVCRPIFIYRTGLSWKNIHHFLAFSTAPRLLCARTSADLVPAVTTISTNYRRMPNSSCVCIFAFHSVTTTPDSKSLSIFEISSSIPFSLRAFGSFWIWVIQKSTQLQCIPCSLIDMFESIRSQ